VYFWRLVREAHMLLLALLRHRVVMLMRCGNRSCALVAIHLLLVAVFVGILWVKGAGTGIETSRNGGK